MKDDLISRKALLEEFRWLKSQANIMRAAEYEEIMARIKAAPAVEVECELSPKTNHNVIRAMGPRELAEFLMFTNDQDLTVAICDDRFCNPENCSNDCLSAAVKWLSSPIDADTFCTAHNRYKDGTSDRWRSDDWPYRGAHMDEEVAE